MQRRNLDLGVPVTREQWLQLGEGANALPDKGVLQWRPDEFDVIRVSARADDAPAGWTDLTPREDARVDEHEVAVFVYNDGRPVARLEPPMQPAPPVIRAEQEREMEVELERWVRGKWRQLMRSSGLHYRADHTPQPPVE